MTIDRFRRGPRMFRFAAAFVLMTLLAGAASAEHEAGHRYIVEGYTLVKILFGIGVVLLALLLPRLLWRVTCGTAGLIDRLRARVPAYGMWERTHPLRAWLASRWPRSYRLVAKRLDARRPGGLPLTLGVAAAIYIAALAGGLVEELLEADELLVFDRAVNGYMEALREEPFVVIFAWITTLGGSATLVAVTLVGTAFLWAYRRWHCILPMWVTVVGAQATTYLGKLALGRERPEFLTAATAVTPSFPSGHTTGAVAVYGFIAYLVARDLPRRRERFEVVYWTVVLVGAVGFSRVYLSVHYASDVLAGVLVGGFWLLVGIMLAQYRGHAGSNHARR